MSISNIPNTEPTKEHFISRRGINKVVKLSAEAIKADIFGSLLVFCFVVIAISEIFGASISDKFYAGVFIILLYVIFRDFSFNYNKTKDTIIK